MKNTTIINEASGHQTQLFEASISISNTINPTYQVYAEHAQDAIDELIDWLEENQPNMVSSFEEILEFTEEEYIDDYISGGNCGLYINSLNVNLEEIN